MHSTEQPPGPDPLEDTQRGDILRPLYLLPVAYTCLPRVLRHPERSHALRIDPDRSSDLSRSQQCQPRTRRIPTCMLHGLDGLCAPCTAHVFWNDQLLTARITFLRQRSHPLIIDYASRVVLAAGVHEAHPYRITLCATLRATAIPQHILFFPPQSLYEKRPFLALLSRTTALHLC